MRIHRQTGKKGWEEEKDIVKLHLCCFMPTPHAYPCQRFEQTPAAMVKKIKLEFFA